MLYDTDGTWAIAADGAIYECLALTDGMTSREAREVGAVRLEQVFPGTYPSETFGLYWILNADAPWRIA